MKIFKLIGHTAWIDWGSGSRPRDIGFYMTWDSAQAEIDKKKKDEHWGMDWDSFEIQEVEVQS